MLPITSLDDTQFAETVLPQVDGVQVGWLARVDDSDRPMVDFAKNSMGPVLARSTIHPGEHGWQGILQNRQSVVLLFENGDPTKPIVIGVIQAPLDQITEPGTQLVVDDHVKDVKLDGRHVLLEAGNMIELRCGKGSITLRRDGKIIIRGTSLVSRSTGKNKIKGASVAIN